MRVNQRDIDALRVGIREQERLALQQEIYQEDYDRRLMRIPADSMRLELVLAQNLRKGDILVSAEYGDGFYRNDTITRIVRNEESPASVWIEWGNLNDPNAEARGLQAHLVAGEGGGKRHLANSVLLVER